MNCLLSHGTITAIGFVYVRAEILSMGNEQILNSLEEGLIITDELHEDKNDEGGGAGSRADEVIFMNQAARKMTGLGESSFVQESLGKLDNSLDCGKGSEKLNELMLVEVPEEAFLEDQVADY